MKIFYFILGTLQAITAIGAIPAGIGYLTDITGGNMGVTPEFLAGSPFNSFLIPGLFLLIINGILNLIAAYLSFSGNRYAGYSGFMLGVILTVWIVLQVLWISLSSFLQPLFFIIGLVNTWIGWKIIKSQRAKANSL